MEPLTSAEKKALRGRAQTLSPQVHVGKRGLAQGVLSEIETAFAKSSLIKLRFDTDKRGIEELCAAIEGLMQCECVGGVGKTRAFFRDPTEHESQA